MKIYIIVYVLLAKKFLKFKKVIMIQKVFKKINSTIINVQKLISL
jgi:hypothetical protein